MPRLLDRFRDHSLLFDPHITSEHEEVEIAVDLILGLIVSKRKDAGRRINDLLAVRHYVKVIALNLLCSHWTYPHVFRAVSRSAEHYSKPLNRYLTVRLSIWPA